MSEPGATPDNPPMTGAQVGARRHVTVLYTHPCHDSFVAAARARVVEDLTAGGFDVASLDLYRDGYDPTGEIPEAHRAQLRRTTALVLVYPTWWGAQPAMLSGWMMALTGSGERLDQVRQVVAVTSHGSPRLSNWFGGRPGFHVLRRFSRATCPAAQRRWLAFYRMDSASDADRGEFIESIGRRVVASLG